MPLATTRAAPVAGGSSVTPIRTFESLQGFGARFIH